MTEIAEGPFKEGLHSDKTGVQRETYSRFVEREGSIFEERWIRIWMNDKDYIDHMESLPVSRSCW